jgi:sec-independent protein translocase protein TatB
MFDIGWSELLLIGIVALIVVGPKDLPRMFAALGRFTARARGMARDFQRAMDEAARDSRVREASDDLKKMMSKRALGLDRLEEAARKLETWDPVKGARPPAPKPALGPETAKLAAEKAAKAAARQAAGGGAAPPAAGAPAAAPEAGDPVPPAALPRTGDA